MSNRNRDEADIAIHLDGRNPMRGQVEIPAGGPRVRFVGWLALLAALERLFNEAPPLRRSPAVARTRKNR